MKNNQPEQSIKSNNQKKQSTQPLNQNALKTNHNKQTRHTINRNKQSYLSITKSVRKYNNNKQLFNQVLPKTTILSISRENNHISQQQNQSQKQSRQTIHNLSIKKPLKTTTTSYQDNKQGFSNIIISPTATASETTANTLFIKTQYNRKRQNNILHFEVTILQTRKSKTLYF